MAALEEMVRETTAAQGGANANGAASANPASVPGAPAEARRGPVQGLKGLLPQGNVGAPDHSQAFAPANTQTLRLKSDGRRGLEDALREAGYSPEEVRSGRFLNQVLKDNRIPSMDALKAGSRVSVPSRSEGGGGFQAPGFQYPGFLNGSGGGSAQAGGLGGSSMGGYSGAFPAPAWQGGDPAWGGGSEPVQDNSSSGGGAGIKPQRQNYDDSCGQSSVAMAVNSLTGKNLTDHDIRRRYGMSLLSGLNAESRGSGYKWSDSGNFNRSKWPLLEKKLNEEKTPVLIGLNGPAFSPSGRGHIVTLMSIDGDKVRYADPADGKIKVTSRQAIESAQPHPDGKFLFTASKAR
jgi:hypothetical protein